MSSQQPQRERLDELLLDRAVDGLDAAEAAELDALLAELGHADPEGYDLAAAAVWVAAGADDQPMPEAVAERAQRTLSGETAGDEAGGAPAQSAPPVSPVPEDQPRPPRRGVAAGWIAAAAALILAIAGWWPQLQDRGPQDLASARDALLANAPDAVRVDWSNTDAPRAQKLGGGYVVWSDKRQQGYMTFRNLPKNDPSRHQYQLWVFDATRSKQRPVDGGVFDAKRNADGEVVIPIHNKLAVRRATMFAVTLEPPGGVVVSDRDPLLWLAKPTQKNT